MDKKYRNRLFILAGILVIFTYSLRSMESTALKKTEPTTNLLQNKVPSELLWYVFESLLHSKDTDDTPRQSFRALTNFGATSKFNHSLSQDSTLGNAILAILLKQKDYKSLSAWAGSAHFKQLQKTSPAFSPDCLRDNIKLFTIDSLFDYSIPNHLKEYYKGMFFLKGNLLNADERTRLLDSIRERKLKSPTSSNTVINCELLEYCLHKKADPCYTTTSLSPLIVALHSSDTQAFEEWYTNPDSNVTSILSEGFSPFLYAVSLGKLNIIKRLMNHPTFNFHSDSSEKGALYYAAQGNQDHILELFSSDPYNIPLRTEADRGYSLFHHACSEGSIDAVRFLLNNPSKVTPPFNVEECNRTGYTPFLTAISNGKEVVARYLVAHNANPHACNQHTKRNALHLAAISGHHFLLSWLVSLGLSVDSKDGDGDTSLMLATTRAKRGVSHCMQAIEVLIKLGADHTLKNKKDKTVLDMTQRSTVTAVRKVIEIAVEEREKQKRVQQS